ncbi:GAF domain-containing protein [Staphylococcus condimenti]|uniref:GAF domain-containing protein n=2 Tax=Staphylococcus condimenti TaxID=70255 RepID=A0A143P9R5_9STAP|nr:MULTISPECIES: GAF domain-containing protein [Staphylococcus]AMY04549.1 Free methionine-(R)-sulfoxide reductase [Staphylococcus condimenti]APR60787.1 Free methionine-(R)-sulfoxide reductase [Staphylococcus condimenti]MDK8644769.1 GAF domain-containing protein [Staphylococcus condimenti]OFO98930.1 Free methionine-(R)-sulfoxide reductase [Staphylococcus sp. HMSC065E08]PNZ62144.1 GAF domain-containing protein [Staphylococcus condimenti]
MTQTTTNYKSIQQQLEGLNADEKYMITLLSNTSALLNENLSNINWLGFYLIEDGQLILGPFQGRPACTPIQIGKGVCGTSVEKDITQRIDDVQAFPGHIACDARSQSEIVIPMHRNGEVIGLLDIDAPIKGRFTADDQTGLESIMKILEKQIAQTVK